MMYANKYSWDVRALHSTGWGIARGYRSSSSHVICNRYTDISIYWIKLGTLPETLSRLM